MGSIGHKQLLYTLNNWQIRAAVRGYYRNQRPTYEAARLLGLWTVSCQRDPKLPPLQLSDLIKFPWDSTHRNSFEAEAEDPDALAKLIEQARAHNASLKQKEQP